MHFLTVFSLLYSLSLILIPTQAFDPFTAGATVMGGLATSWLGSIVFCRYSECCDKPWIAHDFNNLSHSLRDNLFGQHLVQDSVVKLIKGHLTNRKPQKPLVLSFHGWTGTGKTWVSKLIADSLYKEGMDSKFVKFIHVPKWFRDSAKTREQTEKLHHTIESTLARCKYALFIFDDMHVMNPRVLDELIFYMNYPPPMDGLDLTKAIYLLLGNSGATKINDFTIQQFRDGRDRNSIRMNEMHNFISDKIYSEKGAFQDAEIVSRQVIDASIPFLPLERIHVKSCIERAIKERGKVATESLVEKVMEEIRFVPEDLDRFAEFGCKRIDQMITEFL